MERCWIQCTFIMLSRRVGFVLYERTPSQVLVAPVLLSDPQGPQTFTSAPGQGLAPKVGNQWVGHRELQC